MQLCCFVFMSAMCVICYTRNKWRVSYEVDEHIPFVGDTTNLHHDVSGIVRDCFVIYFLIKRDISQYVPVRTDSTCIACCEYVAKKLRVRQQRTLETL